MRGEIIYVSHSAAAPLARERACRLANRPGARRRCGMGRRHGPIECGANFHAKSSLGNMKALTTHAHASDGIAATDAEGNHGGGADPALHWYFHPITNSRAHMEAVEQIVYAILSGAYSVGERLPGIEQLAQAMNVSKPVIGEALKVLTRSKTLRVQRGSSGGLFVLTDRIKESLVALSGQMNRLSLSEIVEARQPIELQLALLAGERATPADFAAMQACVDNLRKHSDGDLMLRMRFDHLFHYSVGRAARSRALAYYQYQILEQLFALLQDYFLYREDPNLVVELHERTLAAIRSREPATIRRAIAEHMRPLEEAVAAMSAPLPQTAPA
ncbi:FadR family transcriptional regulator [Verminephrobacter aporrectodeae subsp. tuberculatae]|nr:FadR family transcriptional regulator [Verminephrobacter aporrectodeae subsp. tuberculatae]